MSKSKIVLTLPELPQIGNVSNLTGQEFSRLKVLGYAGLTQGRQTRWLCSCSCGNLTIVRGVNLTNKMTKSCGCYCRTFDSRRHLTHGMSHTDTWKIWAKMRSRCSKPYESCYANYGGRGITVCESWQKFENFLADMGERPSLAYSLDRINVNGNYEPGNCRWATRLEQANNTRFNRMITYQGRTQSVAQWAREVNMLYWTLKRRLNANWSVEDALFIPVGGQRAKIKLT